MSILKAAGYTVGIFNSPYLEKKNEYLCVNGVDATDDEYALIAGIAKRAVEGVPMEVAKEALRLGAQKLPVSTKFVVRRDYVKQ